MYWPERGEKMAGGTLYLCPTPLGNLEDITLRVLRILQEVSFIAAEDTRHTRKLLSHYDIHTPLTSYHEHNKMKKIPVLMEALLKGTDVALVSDAGMPGIADPGEELVKEAIACGVKVFALPGPSAVITALAASGLPALPFSFFGFIPTRGTKRRKVLAELSAENKTAIFYEAPHRLLKTLQELSGPAQGRHVVVAREMTKIYEEYIRGTLEEVVEHFTVSPPRGECTVLIAPQPAVMEMQQTPEKLVSELVSAGMDNKEAIREAANRLGIPKREVYQAVHTKKI
jgi:16S rRNA (cytidine1402-2'-O)-methyltransferase